MDLVEGIGRANSRKQSTNPNTPSFRKKIREQFSKTVIAKFVFSKFVFSKLFQKYVCSKNMCSRKTFSKNVDVFSKNVNFFRKPNLTQKISKLYNIEI